MTAPVVGPDGRYEFSLFWEWESALLVDVLLAADGPLSTAELAEAIDEPFGEVTAWLALFERVGVVLRVPGCRRSVSWVLNDSCSVVTKLRQQYNEFGPGAGGPPLSRLNRSKHVPGFDVFSQGTLFVSEGWPSA